MNVAFQRCVQDGAQCPATYLRVSVVSETIGLNDVTNVNGALSFLTSKYGCQTCNHIQIRSTFVCEARTLHPEDAAIHIRE